MDEGSQGWHHHSAEQTILLQGMAGRIWRAAEKGSHWKQLRCGCESAWKGREMERIVAPFLGQLQGTLSRFLSHLFRPSFQDIPATVSLFSCWKHGKAKEYPRAYNSHLTLSTWCVTCKSKSQGGKSIWGAVGKEHALHSTTHLIPLCPKASRDKQQLMRVPGCSDGPIFIPMQEQQPGTLTKCNVEQQLWQGCVGFRFNSTATTQLCSADSCPGIHQKLLEALSRSLQAQPHIARQFSFLQLLLSA